MFLLLLIVIIQFLFRIIPNNSYKAYITQGPRHRGLGSQYAFMLPSSTRRRKLTYLWLDFTRYGIIVRKKLNQRIVLFFILVSRNSKLWVSLLYYYGYIRPTRQHTEARCTQSWKWINQVKPESICTLTSSIPPSLPFGESFHTVVFIEWEVGGLEKLNTDEETNGSRVGRSSAPFDKLPNTIILKRYHPFLWIN